MKALVYHGPGRHSWEDVDGPQLVDPGDAIVRVDAVTICGTDLHILKGDVPEVTDGRILGHEAVGTVEEVGTGVTQHQAGRPRAGVVHLRVRTLPLLPRRTLRPVPGGGGWILGHLIDGTQAEYVRTPFADTSLYRAAPTP